MNPAEVMIDVLNMTGQKIKEVNNGVQLSGKHVLELNDLARGIYLVRLTTPDKVMTTRIVKL